MSKTLIFLLLLLLLGCSKPSEDIARGDFYKIYPDATIVNIGIGEGDADNIYYEIVYRDDSNLTLKKTLLYQKVHNAWKFIKTVEP